MNQPYVKQYDEKGVHINPIVGIYPQSEPNRRQRKSKSDRFHGESKNHHLTVAGKYKFKRVRQIEYDKYGNRKTIIHYLIS